MDLHQHQPPKKSANRSRGTPPDDCESDSESLLPAAHRHLLEYQPADAVELLLQAVERFPDDRVVLETLASAYHQNGQLIPALKTYDRLIELGVATAETWCKTGDLLTDVGEEVQAIGAYENGLKLDPKNSEMHHNLARVCYRLGRVDDAAEHLEIAVRESDANASWLALATLIPAAPGASQRRILKVRQDFARRLAAEVDQLQLERPVAAPRHDQRRIGYVSAFFSNCNYMKPVWALINNHDRSRFQLHLFSDSPAAEGMPGYRSHPADRVYETDKLNNAQLAELIRSSEIDILVDLNGYSTPERLPLFLGRCTPLTVGWFNMYATSGMPGFDYIVGDDSVVRVDEDRFYTEKVLRLPVSYLTFEVTHPVPPVVPPPCVKGGHVTFGSLVSQYKITASVLDAWAEILRRAEGASLLLANRALKSRYNREYMLAEFAQRGVEPQRIRLSGPAGHLDFLRYYDQIDVALDAFPYNGGTTTMEAIWQGVPVLAFDGDRWASRTSKTLLDRCHLHEFVADDVAGMVHQAVELARDPDSPTRLSLLRREMRDRLSASSVCDAAALARSMEEIYRQIWDRHVGDS